MLTKRPCAESDRQFVYSVMKENMKGYFDRNTKEGWSDEKFHSGFRPERITILEMNGTAAGFYDVEDRGFLYVHNLQMRKGVKINGFAANALIDREARARGIKTIKAKVFTDNKKFLRLSSLSGYSILNDPKLLSEENSVYVVKELHIENDAPINPVLIRRLYEQMLVVSQIISTSFKMRLHSSMPRS